VPSYGRIFWAIGGLAFSVLCASLIVLEYDKVPMLVVTLAIVIGTLSVLSVYLLISYLEETETHTRRLNYRAQEEARRRLG
jgi:membrane protein implicated in regulation of membrane protease activity